MAKHRKAALKKHASKKSAAHEEKPKHEPKAKSDDSKILGSGNETNARAKEQAEYEKMPQPAPDRTIPMILWGVAIILSILFIVMAINGRPGNIGVPSAGSGMTDESSDEKVEVVFYVMSQCPYGTQVEDAIKPVLDKMGKNIDFSLDFIASDNGDGTFRSLHGEPEVLGNIVQLCAAKHAPERYMDMIVCQNKDAANIPENWESCAKESSLDEEKIRTCYEGEEGKDLLRASIERSEAAQAQGSPTIYIAGKEYSGGRGTNDFFRAICGEFSDDMPAACNSIPKPKKVSMVLLNDKRCAECDTTQLVAQLSQIFPGLEITELDYSEERAKELYESLALKALPAVLFGEDVAEAENYEAVKTYLEPAGEYLNLRIGASFDPTAEICGNGIDDNNDKKIDCDDATCKYNMICMEEKDLQVFIMSDCPYGRKAIEALKEIKDNFGSDFTYDVHYIASENKDGTFRSLHGQYEVDEDIVQLCVKEHSPDEWLAYMYCRATKGVKGIGWKACAEDTGVDVKAVDACFSGTEGKALLSEDIKLAEAIKITGSPTWLANNRHKFGGIYSESVKQVFCQYNEDMRGCENTLSQTGEVSGSCG